MSRTPAVEVEVINFVLWTMPGNKRWHFEAQDEAVFIFRDGKEVFHSRKEQPLGPVKEIFYGAEHPQAKSFKAQAIEVSVQ